MSLPPFSSLLSDGKRDVAPSQPQSEKHARAGERGDEQKQLECVARIHRAVKPVCKGALLFKALNIVPAVEIARDGQPAVDFLVGEMHVHRNGAAVFRGVEINLFDGRKLANVTREWNELLDDVLERERTL